MIIKQYFKAHLSKNLQRWNFHFLTKNHGLTPFKNQIWPLFKINILQSRKTCFLSWLKTSWIAMLRVLPPMFKPVNNLICCKTGLMWMVKRATSLFNSFCSNFAKQVVLDYKMLNLNSSHIGFSQRGQPMILVKKWKFYLCIFLDKLALKCCLMIIEVENKPS